MIVITCYCYSSREGHGDFGILLPDARPQSSSWKYRRNRPYVCFLRPSGQSHVGGGIQQRVELKKTLLSSCGTVAQVAVETSRKEVIVHACTHTYVLGLVCPLALSSCGTPQLLLKSLGVSAGLTITREGPQKVERVLHSAVIADRKV